MRIEAVDTGATSISRRKPNSRSQTIEMPAKAAVKSTEIAMTPGNRNVVNATDPAPSLLPSNEPSPVPSTNRNSSGWASDDRMRERSLTKRIISRCHTTAAARASVTRLLTGTRTASGVNVVVISVPSSASPWDACSARPPRRGSSCRCGPGRRRRGWAGSR